MTILCPLNMECSKNTRQENWRDKLLKEAEYMLGYEDLNSRSSVEINSISETLIKKEK